MSKDEEFREALKESSLHKSLPCSKTIKKDSGECAVCGRSEQWEERCVVWNHGKGRIYVTEVCTWCSSTDVGEGYEILEGMDENSGDGIWHTDA